MMLVRMMHFWFHHFWFCLQDDEQSIVHSLKSHSVLAAIVGGSRVKPHKPIVHHDDGTFVA